MSRLQELIRELCPDGVEYKALGDVGVFMRGSSFQKKHFVEDGTPCIHYGQVHTRFNIATDEVMSYLDESFAAKMKRAQPGDLIIATTSEDDDAVGKAIAWLGDTDVVVSNDAYIYRHELDPKYMAYVFASDLFQEPKRQYITGTKVRRLNDKGMSKIVIPVPPIEVQLEVVRILDEYTAAHDELVRQLEEEMGLREQQLSIARNEMCVKEEWPFEAVGDVFTTITGGTPKKSNADYYGDDHPFYKPGDLRHGSIVSSAEDGLTDEGLAPVRNVPIDTVLVTCIGTIGKAAIVGEPGACNQQINAILPRDDMDMAFFLHVICSDYFRTQMIRQCGTGNMPILSRGKFDKLMVPVPPREVQDRLASVLDGLSEAINESLSLLREELSIREQLLSGVRNKLLSFPEKAGLV